MKRAVGFDLQAGYHESFSPASPFFACCKCDCTCDCTGCTWVLVLESGMLSLEHCSCFSNASSPALGKQRRIVMKLRTLRWAALLVCALLFAACGTSAGQAVGPTAAPTSTPTPAR